MSFQYVSELTLEDSTGKELAAGQTRLQVVFKRKCRRSTDANLACVMMLVTRDSQILRTAQARNINHASSAATFSPSSPDSALGNPFKKVVSLSPDHESPTIPLARSGKKRLPIHCSSYP